MDKAFAKWPLRGNVNVQLSKKVNLFKSLIKYSTNLDKIERFEKSKSLEYLDNLPEASLLIAEYNTQNSISPSTINNYKSFLKAQLLHEFKINHITEYCNTNMIISFFNDFNDNRSQIEDYWLIKAQKLSQKFPLDFCISIPNFTALDIISLLINPVTKKQGCIFNAIQVPTQIIGYFQNLLTLSISNIGQIPIEIFKIAKTFIQNNHPRIFDQYIKSTNDISEILYQIQNNNILTDIEYLIIIFQDVINISFEINQPFYNQLDLSDIKNLDFDNFNQYINQYPKKGFYICQYPETKEYFNSMHELCTNFGPQDEKIPLSLFEFRIFIQFYKIEFEPPKNVNLYDFPDLITKEINDNLNSRYFNLSHLIGLLLSNVPSFVTETFYSEYVRNIIINMITLPESDNIKQEMIKILKEMISQLIQMISADGWENTIEKQLNYNPEQKSIFNFLANPWRYTLPIIDQKIRPGYLQKVNDTIKRFDDIKSVLNDLTSSFTLHSLNNCIESDIDFFKTKAVQPLRRKIVPISQLNNARREFSKNAKLYYEYLIPEFPEFSMNRNSDPYVSEDFFDNLFNFLDENDTDDVSDDSHEIIAIIPIKPNSNYVRTLIYSTNFDRYKVTFKTLGNVMLFKPPNDEFISEDDIYSKTDSIRIFFLHYDDRVTNYNSSSIYNLSESFNNFIDIYRRYQDNRMYENRINRISHNLNQSSILFGGNNINEFTRKLVTLKYQSENKESIVQKAEFIERFNQEMSSLKNVTFYVNVDLEDPLLRFSTPRDTTNYLLNILSNISFTNIDFRYYTNRLKNEESFRNECQELDDLITKSKSLSLKPTNENVINISDEDIEKNQNYILSAPLIFKEGDSLKVSAKTIEVTCDPLILGIDMSPFQIRLPNISNNEILCEFHQTNNDLPLPTFKNENDILIIEISTENLYKNALNNQSNSNDEEIDVEFKFEGTVSLRAKLDPNLTTEIEYSITLHYISLTTFILMEDKHYFAFKKDKVEIVPFLISSNSKLVFEKFYDHKINSTMIANTVSQLTDNNAIIPQFSDTSLNGQIYNFIADFSNEYNPKNSHISLNFEFGLEKEKSIIASFQTDILPPLTLAIFSDETQNFEKENIIINIGNLTRKVYFVVELMNNDKKEARISNVNIRTNDDNNLIYHNFDPNKNFQTIRPGKYGYIICFFEVRYSGPSPFQYQENIIDSTLVVEFEGKSQEINFKYMIQTVQIQESSIQYCGNKDNFYYYNLSNKKFIKCDIDEINDDTTFRGFEKQILLSPFSCNLFIKLNEYPKVSYNIQDGRLLGISNEAQKKIEYEVFSYLFDENKFEIKSVEDITNIQINDKEIYILARIKDEPDSYFPLFCPINGKDIQFDLCENIEFENIYSIFFNFFTNMMTEDDFQERIRYLDKSLFNLFNYHQLLSLHNFSYLIDLFGKNRKSILFKRVIISISKFTNSYEIKNNFYLIINKYGEKNKNVRFYAFVSVLNKLINDRFIHLQEQQFYIQFPIDFDIVKKRQQNILNKVVKDESKDICKYIIDAKSRIKKINKYELEKKKEYEDNGFTITQVLKWDQKNGLTASNMDELKSYKKIKNKAFTKDIQVKNYLQFNNNSLTKFPEIISIKSIYQKFDEILKFEYLIPSNIDELIQNSNFNQIKKLLNQLYILYDWQMKNSICFPFYSLKTKFTNILAFILSKFNISKLNLPFIPLDQFKPSIFELDFVQIPKLGYEQDDDDNKSQKDTNDENISEKEDEGQDNEENIEEYELYSESDAKEDNNNENDDQRNEENIEEDKLDKNINEKEEEDDKKDVKNDDEDEEYDLNSENDAKEDDNDEKDIKNDEDEEYDLNSENDAKEKDNDEEDVQKNEEHDLNSTNDAKDSDNNEKNAQKNEEDDLNHKNDSKENDNDEINDESTVNIQKDNNDGRDDDLEEDCYEIDNEEEENEVEENYISSNINFLFNFL